MKDIRQENWTLQEIFDFACQHLAQQKRQCSTPGDFADSCEYLREDGAKCAYGAFIPQEDYRPEFEGKSSDGLRDRSLYVAPAFRVGRDFASSQHRRLADALQAAHDGSRTLDQLKNSLGKIARSLSLSLDAVDQVTEWNVS